MKILRLAMLAAMVVALTGAVAPLRAQQGNVTGTQPTRVGAPSAGGSEVAAPTTVQPQQAGFLDDNFVSQFDTSKWAVTVGSPKSIEAKGGLLATYQSGQSYSVRGTLASKVTLPPEFCLLLNVVGGAQIKQAYALQPAPASALPTTFPTGPAFGAPGAPGMPAAPGVQFGRPTQPGSAPQQQRAYGAPTYGAPTYGAPARGAGQGLLSRGRSRRAEKGMGSDTLMEFQGRKRTARATARGSGGGAARPTAAVAPAPRMQPWVPTAPAGVRPVTVPSQFGVPTPPAYQPYPVSPEAAALVATLRATEGWQPSVTGDYLKPVGYVPGVQFGVKLICSEGNLTVALRSGGEPTADSVAGVEVVSFSQASGEQTLGRVPVPAGEWCALRIDVRQGNCKVYVGAQEFEHALPGVVQGVQLGDVAVGGIAKPAKATSYLLTNLHLRPFASPQPAGGLAEAITGAAIVQGDEYLSRNDYENARVMYERAYVGTPDSVEALAKLGYAQGVTRSVKEGLTLCSRAVDRSPNSHFAHLYRGRLLYAMGRDAETRQELSTAVALQPDSPEALFYSARALADSELRPAFSRRPQDKEAAELYRAAIAKAGTYADAWEGLGLLYYDRGEGAPAVEALEKALLYDPQRLAPRRALVELYEGRGQARDAAGHRAAMRRNWPAYPRWEQISLAAEEMGAGGQLAGAVAGAVEQAGKLAASGALRPAFQRLRWLEKPAAMGGQQDNLWVRCVEAETKAAEQAGQGRLWQMVRFCGFEGWHPKYAYPASAEARGSLVSPAAVGPPFGLALAPGAARVARESFAREGSLYATRATAGADAIPAAQEWRGAAGLAIGTTGLMSHIENRSQGWQLLAIKAIYDVLRHRHQLQGALSADQREVIRSLFRSMAWPEPGKGADPRYWDRWALAQMERAIQAWEAREAGGAFREWGHDYRLRSGKRDLFWNWGGSLRQPNAEQILWLEATWLLRNEAAREFKRALAGGIAESLEGRVRGYWQWNDKVTPNLLDSRAGHALAYGVADNPGLTYLLDLMGFAGRAYAGLDANVRQTVAGTGPRRSLGYTEDLALGGRFFFEGYNILTACNDAGYPVRTGLKALLENEVNVVRAWRGNAPTYAFRPSTPQLPWASHR